MCLQITSVLVTTNIQKNCCIPLVRGSKRVQQKTKTCAQNKTPFFRKKKATTIERKERKNKTKALQMTKGGA
jgi:hypothetical protein